MKRILFTARDLNLGGIEKALVTLANYLLKEENDVTLILEKKEGPLIKELEGKIKVEEYKPSNNKIYVIRKIINMFKRIKASFKYRNKFDVSISFATYSIPGSFLARLASKNTILWGHADYLSLFKEENKMKEFFSMVQYDKFSKIVFVSKAGKESFLKVFPNKKDCTYCCNNLIDYKKIRNMSQEEIEIKPDSKITTFLNVGRHDERQKKLTRIIEASKRLMQEGYKFRVIFVGEGKDTGLYKSLAEKYSLEDYIIFEGARQNPYPYFRISDCVVLSSDYEGYPVVFLESFALNKAIITTKVSDYEDVENGKGIVCNKNEEDIYKAMKKFIENKCVINVRFDMEEYNKNIKKTIKDILN